MNQLQEQVKPPISPSELWSSVGRYSHTHCWMQSLSVCIIRVDKISDDFLEDIKTKVANCISPSDKNQHNNPGAQWS